MDLTINHSLYFSLPLTGEHIFYSQIICYTVAIIRLSAELHHSSWLPKLNAFLLPMDGCIDSSGGWRLSKLPQGERVHPGQVTNLFQG